jgi:hypothetical protein
VDLFRRVFDQGQIAAVVYVEHGKFRWRIT